MVSLKKRLESVEGSRVELPWYRQMAWRKFFENLSLFAMLFGMVSFMITYVTAILVFGVEPQVAFIYMIVHLAIAAFGFVFMIIRDVYAVTARTYLSAFWFDSLTHWWQRMVELVNIEPLEIDKLFSTNPHPPELESVQEAKVILSQYNNYLVTLAGIENPMRIIMIPKPYTDETALKTHREAVTLRFPIPAKVCYAVFTLMVTVPYEDEVLPIYELTYAPGMVADRQKNLPWFIPDKKAVEKALFDFDTLESTKWRMKSQAQDAHISTLLALVQIMRKFGHDQTDEAIKNYEQTFGRGQKSSSMSWFIRHFWHLILIGSVVLAAVLIWAVIVPWLTPSTPQPPLGGW